MPREHLPSRRECFLPSHSPVIGSLSVTLPAGDTATLGRPVPWNVVAQYRLGKMFWPEVETNATYFHGGPNDDKTQDFVTPGLMVREIKLSREATNRLTIVFGIGDQNRNLAFSHLQPRLDRRFLKDR
jgi:hypothetical protein